MILPIMLSFAAGAMLYVTVVELIPESMASKNKRYVNNLKLSTFLLSNDTNENFKKNKSTSSILPSNLIILENQIKL